MGVSQALHTHHVYSLPTASHSPITFSQPQAILQSYSPHHKPFSNHILPTTSHCPITFSQPQGILQSYSPHHKPLSNHILPTTSHSPITFSPPQAIVQSHSPHHKPANQPFLQGACSFDWRLAFRNRDRLLMKGTSGAVEKGIEAGAWGWNPASWVWSPQRHDVPAMGARREFTSIDLGSQVLLHQGLPNPRGQCQEDPSSGKIVRGAGAEVRGVTT